MNYSQTAEMKQSFSTGNSKLSDAYRRWFEVIPANTPELREEAYRLRYQVYCCEHHFETLDEHPHKLEADAFDDRSIHSLVVDKANGMPTGTVRLILPDPDSPESSFPIQHICGDPLSVHCSPFKAAEISRFSISKKMRNVALADCPKDMKCLVALGLMQAIVQMSTAHDITDWFAVMEPSLLRLLCRFGIYFTPIGPMVEYHGMRQPCHADSETLLDRVRKEHFSLWEFLMEPHGLNTAEKSTAANF